MKNFKLLFSAAVASALMGCSSMEVDEQDAFAENLPADFKYQEYMAIHPELRYLQLKDQVAELNASADAELKSADEAAFDTNSAQLYAMYLDPYMGGYTQADWDNDQKPHVITDTIAVDVYKWVSSEDADGKKSFTLDSSAALTVYLCDESNKIVGKAGAWSALKGEVGAECTADGAEHKVAISMSTPKATVTGDVYKIVDGSFKVGEKEAAGGISADKLKKMKELNIISTLDDYNTLLALPVDTFAISYQFTMFGKLHGWAYRLCNDAEKQKPIASPVYPADKLYCDDNGKPKEIN